MSFGQPLFLLALISLAIPVIIHLFNFRRYKKIYFTNVRFISEITQESRKRNELKHLLILAARILAIASLVLAFAHPYIPSPLQHKRTSGAQAISIYIDNSFSMEALTRNGHLLDEAKSRAMAIANAAKPSDLFQLLTTDLEGRHQRFVNRDEFKNLVDEVKISPAVRNIGDIMSRQSEFLASSGNRSKSAYIISDFQISSSYLKSRPDTSVNWFLVPVTPGVINNLYIDSAWFDRPSSQPETPVRLMVSIRNSSSGNFEKIPLKLSINGAQKAVSSFQVAPEGRTVVTLPFTNAASGYSEGVLEIPDYPITRDDSFYLTWPVTSSIPVLCINGNGENPYLNALFGEDSAVMFRNIPARQLDYSSFPRYSLIIADQLHDISSGLSRELIHYINDGGNVLFIPADDGDLLSYNGFLSLAGVYNLERKDTARMRISYINTASHLFDDVFERDATGKYSIPENADFPYAYRYFITRKTTRSVSEDLMSLQNGNSFLSVTHSGKGKIYLISSPVDEKSTNFPKNSLFVPVMYKIALLSQPDIPLYQTLGRNEGIELQGDTGKPAETYRIKKEGSDFEIIPETRNNGQMVILYPHDQITEAGNYLIYSGNKVIRGVSFNYDRRESDLQYLSPSAINNLLKNNNIRYGAVIKGSGESIAKQISEFSQGIPLWKYFVIAALLFLLAEILLVRLLKD